jgi:hypothetical protein
MRLAQHYQEWLQSTAGLERCSFEVEADPSVTWVILFGERPA